MNPNTALARAVLADGVTYRRRHGVKGTAAFRPITKDEVRALHAGQRVAATCFQHTHCTIWFTVTSVKTWKRRPDVEVRVKFGLHGFDVFTLPDALDRFLVEL